MRAWYCEQMDRNGVGKLAPRYEFEPDGITPVIYTVFVSDTDSEIRLDPFINSRSAAIAAGVPIDSPGEIWLLIPEIHLQNPDGSIDGGESLANGNGSGDDPGVAVVSGPRLSLMNFDSLRDNTAYDGLIIPEIGPYPLVQDISFEWFAGTTISSIVSGAFGVITHETAHGLGLEHDFRHDTNANGNLMGNGLRGVRGALFPDLYPQNHTRLAYSSALALSVSRYFSGCELISVPFDLGGQSAASTASSQAPEPRPECDEEKVCGEDLSALLESLSRDTSNTLASQQNSFGSEPVVTILTPDGSQAPVAGQIQIDFSAEDPDGLFLALLVRIGNPGTIAELRLSGTDITATFATSNYTAGTDQTFSVIVYDVEGNRSVPGHVDLTPLTGLNQGPAPRFQVTLPQDAPGANLLFGNLIIGDPDGALAALPYEWQFDESEPFTPPDTEIDTIKSYPTAGVPLVRLRVTDDAGAVEVSTPIAVRIGEACGDGIDNDGDGLIDYPVDWGCASVRSVRENPQCNDDIDNDGDSSIDWDGGSQGGSPDPQCTVPWRNDEGEGNVSPVVGISSPTDGSVIPPGASVTFSGSASDLEDGDLTANLNWDSDLDGPIGTGGSFSTVLSHDGSHLITASVSDTLGEDDSDAITVTAGTCDNDGICEQGEDCNICPSDCVGDGSSFCCGLNSCESGEDVCSCSLDCGLPAPSEQPSLTCGDTLDNDCDLLVDCNDQDCSLAPECTTCNNNTVCELYLNEDCNSCSDCNGVNGGPPENHFCCGDDFDCNDSQCTGGVNTCVMDTDGDGVPDPDDNCLVLVNGPGTTHVTNPRIMNGSTQCDDDLDGFGNLCDCDFNQDGLCNVVDFSLILDQLGLPLEPGNEIFDLDCQQQSITFADINLYILYLDGSISKRMSVDDPLLSGLACADPTSTAGGCPSP